MGTNYYLKKKVNYQSVAEWESAEYDAANHFRLTTIPENSVLELNNGYVYDNTYYKDLEELNKTYRYRLHIGKSSFGWHFGLCAYPEYNINNLEDWKREFLDPDAIIEDEYGNTVTPEEMISVITDRKQKNYDPANQAKEELEQLQAANEFKIAHGEQPYKTYEQLLESNTAERGLNGLWAHKSTGFLQFTRTDGTYDITTQWDFC